MSKFILQVTSKSHHSVQRKSNEIINHLCLFRQSFAFLKASSHVMHLSTALATRASHHMHATPHEGSSASSATNGYHDVCDVRVSHSPLFILFYPRLSSPPNQQHLPRRLGSVALITAFICRDVSLPPICFSPISLRSEFSERSFMSSTNAEPAPN